MFDTAFGLPLHPLVVHAVVVLAPLTVVLLVAYAVSERFRVWSGWLTPAVASLTLVLSFVATQSGEPLEHRVGESALVREHAEYGDVLPWVVLAATVLAWALWLVRRRSLQGGSAPSGLFRVLAVVGVVAALGLAVDVALVGHSGAAAVWSGTPAQSAAGGDGD